MNAEKPSWTDLILRPTAESPPDMPPGEVVVSVPLHPRGRPAQGDERWQVGFPHSLYVKAAAPVTYDVPAGMTALCEWYEGVFDGADYAVRPIVGRTQRGGDTVEWTVLNVSPARMRDVIIQVTLNAQDEGQTAVTYRVEQHWVPGRDPAAFLPPTVQRVEVEYTFMNGPQHRVRRANTDPTGIQRLVEEINGCERDTREVALGRMMDRWATLRFVTEESPAIDVAVDPAHGTIRVGAFPPLLGSIWTLLTEIAPPE